MQIKSYSRENQGRISKCIQDIELGILSASVLDGVTIALMKHHDQKQVGKERVCLAYTSTSESLGEGSLGRSSNRAGADAEAFVGCGLLACYLSLTQPAFL